MPSITVMYWNVADLGNNSPDYRFDFVPICNFIAKTARSINADIIFVMETKRAFMGELIKLRTALDTAFAAPNTWQSDWVPGAIRGDVTTRFVEDETNPRQKGEMRRRIAEAGKVGSKRRRDGELPAEMELRSKVTKLEELGFSPVAHCEGYLLLWNKAAAGFTMEHTSSYISGGVDRGLPVKGAAPAQHALSLVYEGREVLHTTYQAGTKSSQTLYEAKGYPPAAGTYAWKLLDFWENSGRLPRWFAVRRPAYCLIRLKTVAPLPDADAIVPIMASHAPSIGDGKATAGTLSGAIHGTQFSSFSQVLYELKLTGAAPATVFNKGVIGGDFNIDSQSDFAYAYKGFTDPRGSGDRAGAGLTQYVPSRTGTVNAWLSQSYLDVGEWSYNGVTSTWTYDNVSTPASDSGYRKFAIDNLFWRGFTSASTPAFSGTAQANWQIYDLQTAVGTTAQLGQAAFDCFYHALNAKFAALGGSAAHTNPQINYDYAGATILGPPYTHIESLFNLIHDLNINKQLTSPQNRSEFLRAFVSDHLPVVAKLDF